MMGDSMVKYTKKVAKKISNFKKASFSRKHKKVNFILKLLSPQLGLLRINYNISKFLK